MRSWPSLLVVSGLWMGLPACKDKGAVDTATLDPECRTLTWDDYGEGYLRSWCGGCHSSAVPTEGRAGAPEGVDFDTHDGLLEHLDRVQARATGDAPTMPPVGGADAEERERFALWLDCGAP